MPNFRWKLRISAAEYSRHPSMRTSAKGTYSEDLCLGLAQQQKSQAYDFERKAAKLFRTLLSQPIRNCAPRLHQQRPTAVNGYREEIGYMVIRSGGVESGMIRRRMKSGACRFPLVIKSSLQVCFFFKTKSLHVMRVAAPTCSIPLPTARLIPNRLLPISDPKLDVETPCISKENLSVRQCS